MKIILIVLVTFLLTGCIQTMTQDEYYMVEVSGHKFPYTVTDKNDTLLIVGPYLMPIESYRIK